MGAAESTSVLEDHERLIQRFTGKDAIPLDDAFWNELLAFPYPLSKLNPQDVDTATRQACAQLVHHNAWTGHFPKLLIHLIRELETAGSAKELPVKAVNTVYFTRLFVKHLVELYSSKEISSHLVMRGDEGTPADLLLPTVRSLLSFVANTEANPATYLLQLECVNLLLVMFATQLHTANLTALHLFLDCAMKQHDLAAPFIRRLVVLYMAQEAAPPRLPLFPRVPGDAAGNASVLRRMGSSVASVFLLPYTAYSYLVSSPAGPGAQQAPLADNSLLLLLVLVHFGHTNASNSAHEEGYSDGASGVSNAGVDNPFRRALCTARDTDFDAVDASMSPSGRFGPVVRVSYAKLYDTLGACLKDDKSTLLLYSLLHANPSFLEYVLVRTDLDTLLLPLLELLYGASRRSPNQIYMLLIILLILSQDASFNANVHKLMLPGVPWYRERLLPRISLGSLMVVILIRTVKYNLSKLRDVYLHTNCLATLANMAPHAHHLNAYASQRLVSLFDMLAKKYTKLSEASARAGPSPSSLVSPDPLAAAPATTGPSSEGGDGAPTELHIYTDFLRIVLEIMNAILTYALPRNPEVVYALLHRQELFQPFRNHPRFNELLENIFTVLDFFNVRMDASRLSLGEVSVERVLEVVVANARQWRGEGMKMFTELRFTYEEELHPEEFFIPYVWTLVVAQSGIPWDPGCIDLFPSSQHADAQLEDIQNSDAYDVGYDAASDYADTPRESV